MSTTLLSPTALDLGRRIAGQGVLPSPGTLVLYVADVAEQGRRAALLASQVLDDAELRRAAGFRHDEDRACYQVAHVALRLVLGHLVGCAPAQVRLTRSPCPGCGGPNGRPVIDGHDLHFSLSHTRSQVLLAFANLPVGVDVEAVPSSKIVQETAVALEPREGAELAALPAAERPAAFTRAWVRKEACGKATGEGLAHDGLQRYVGTGPLSAPVGPELELYDVAAPLGHAAAVAVRSDSTRDGAPTTTPTRAVARSI